MPQLFDDSAFDDDEVEPPSRRQAGYGDDSTESLEDVADEEMAEAEKRLAKAAYYKVIVVNGVVEDDGTDHATEVNAEVRLWARQRMSALLNLTKTAEPVTASFTEPQVEALRRIANRAMAMASTPPEPAVRMASPPTPKPIVAKQPVRSGAVQPRKRKEREVTQRPSKTKPSTGQDVDDFPSGQVFVDPKDGVEYKWVDNPRYDPDNPRSKSRFKSRVTNQVTHSPAQQPMPSAMAMEAISANQTYDTIRQLGVSSPITGAPVADSSVGVEQGLLAATISTVQRL